MSATCPFDVEGLLATIGDTPLIPVRTLARAGVEVWAKAEWFNPGGSVKDRPALSMILDAERRGLLSPGRTILDASSGNTAIAYAMIAAARGYRLRICLPGNAGIEKKRLLRAYGAEIVETDPLAGSDGAIAMVRRLAAEDATLCYLDQYSNDANWQAHYRTTGPEIWEGTAGRVTHFVATLGTSGTFVGTTRFLKEKRGEVVCVAVEPDSPFHGLEGMKHMKSAMVPRIYDPALADRLVAVRTERAYEMVRRLARSEGLLVGPSGGAALAAVEGVVADLESGVVVTVLPDSGARYLSEPHIFGLSVAMPGGKR